MSDYARQERDAARATAPRDLTRVWERLTPLASAPAGVVERVDELCATKRISRATLEHVEGVRYRSRGKGPELLLAWAYEGRLNGHRVVTAIKYRNLGTGARDNEDGSVFVEPMILGDPLSLDWFTAEGETDAARLYELVGDAAAIMLLPAGALTFKPEWAALVPRGATVHLAHDADAEGDKGAAKATRALGARTVRVRPPDGVKDWCAWDGDRVAFVELVRAARAERPRFELEPIEAFAQVDEPDAVALIGTADDALLAANSDAMLYGDGGTGKSTMAVDLAFHLAAGDDWLGIEVPKRLRVALVEAEGSRGMFRRKARRKVDSWNGSPIEGRVHVLSEPWGALALTEPDAQQALADELADKQVDVVIVGPLTAIGMDAPGTIAEARGFLQQTLEPIRRLLDRPIAFLLLHHEAKGGKVSGAWEGVGDTLMHLQAHGHGKAALRLQKVRYGSGLQSTTINLVWGDGATFVVDETAQPSRPERTWNDIAAYVLAHGGCAWNEVEDNVSGKGAYLRRRRKEMLADGELINVGRGQAFELWHRDDPSRPSLEGTVSREGHGRDAVASGTGDRGENRTVSPRPPVRGDAVRDAVGSPSPDELDDEEGEPW
ncbi:bifunctional DNA primase/helicase [Gaiella sp.]|uniref:bifunctional DNA primase/helicase n=1 Tax=Gaiella sp. TaxID=2663207 RepID=UPI002E33D9B0|nr:bifunctional DNA primase/helicase [Gaiella sp.]HEX5582516.1 bifunctional DNA primase/helicase [Gaiella sp.]